MVDERVTMNTKVADDAISLADCAIRPAVIALTTKCGARCMSCATCSMFGGKLWRKRMGSRPRFHGVQGIGQNYWLDRAKKKDMAGEA